MGKPSVRQPAVIERRYLVQDSACTEALALLLKKKAGGSNTGEDDAERRSDDIRANPIIPRR